MPGGGERPTLGAGSPFQLAALAQIVAPPAAAEGALFHWTHTGASMQQSGAVRSEITSSPSPPWHTRARSWFLFASWVGSLLHSIGEIDSMAHPSGLNGAGGVFGYKDLAHFTSLFSAKRHQGVFH